MISSLSALFDFFFDEKTLLSPLVVEKVPYSPILHRFLTGGKMAACFKLTGVKLEEEAVGKQIPA